MKRIIYIIVVIAISIYGCANDQTANISAEGDQAVANAGETETEITDSEEHSHEGEIEFTEEQRSRIDFATELVMKGSFGQVIKAEGQILPVSGGEQLLVAATSGIVSFQGTNTVEGGKATIGRPLFYIDGGNLSDNNIGIRYSETENEYLRAKSEYERKVALAAEQIVSDAELISARTEFLNVESVYNNLKNSFSSGRFAISPGINGYIQHISVVNGQHVDAGEPLATVVKNDQLFVRVELRQIYASLLDDITTANFSIPNGTTYTLDDLKGSLVAYGRSTDQSHPLLPVTFKVENPGDLVPGTFMDVSIVTNDTHEALTVPNSSIIEEMGAYFVFVELHEDMYGKMAVTLGGTDGIRTEILAGLNGEETVVTKGAIFVKLAQGAGTLDAHAGHVH